MTPNPWPHERVVVVSDDPPAVEAAVTQLEAWGAAPAVMFERSRALAALAVQEPDLVVLDFGRDAAAARSVLVRLEDLQPVLPGAAHPAPVVALAEGPLVPRLEQDAWAPLHVAPHDDPKRVREALLAALDDAQGGTGALLNGTAVAGVPAPATATAVAATARGRSTPAIGLVPALVMASVFGVAGLGAALALGQRAGDPQAANTASPTLAGSVPTAAVPPAASSAPPAAAPTAVPATAAPTVAAVTPVTATPLSPTALPPSPTLLAGAERAVGPAVATPADAAEMPAASTPARLPVTGGR